MRNSYYSLILMKKTSEMMSKSVCGGMNEKFFLLTDTHEEDGGTSFPLYFKLEAFLQLNACCQHHLLVAASPTFALERDSGLPSRDDTESLAAVVCIVRLGADLLTTKQHNTKW
jgi:hypothetical protein